MYKLVLQLGGNHFMSYGIKNNVIWDFQINESEPYDYFDQ